MHHVTHVAELIGKARSCSTSWIPFHPRLLLLSSIQGLVLYIHIMDGALLYGFHSKGQA